MKVILILLAVILSIITLPFRLLDYIFIGFWVERKAKKWRKNPKVGDKVYFNNIVGGKTEATIKKLDRKDAKNRGARIESRGFASRTSRWMELDDLYPQ